MQETPALTRVHEQLFKRAAKLAHICRCYRYVRALGHGVPAAVEHEPLLRALDCRTVVDIGANRGQFALVASKCFPEATVYSFEPLPAAAQQFRRVFSGDQRAILHETAIGSKSGRETIHVSGKEDSSSLLPITRLQDEIFPGTAEVNQQAVNVAPLNQFVQAQQIAPPALLKLDVQGYELEALKGCESLLERFSYVYVECSFVKLYAGQASASEVAEYLHRHGFLLEGVYNLTYDGAGLAIQGDFLYSRANAAQV
jgi:FkbM family methyltransferase